MEVIGFRLDYSNNIGGGHLKRCLAIANKISNYDIFFIIKTDCKNIKKTINNIGYKCILINVKFTLSEEITFLKSFLRKNELKAIFFDISNQSTYKYLNQIPYYFNILRKKTENLILLDGMSKDSIIYYIKKLNVKFVVTPYLGAKLVKGPFVHLFGPNYFILNLKVSKNFLIKKNKTPKIASNILVTMGQSDPYNLSLLTVEAILPILKLFKTIKIVLIFGPLFSADLKRKIMHKIFLFKIFFKVVDSPASMNKYYMWSDLAISSTGLTKYELAFFGVPSILISSTRENYKLHNIFSGFKSSVHVGPLPLIKTSTLSKEIIALLNDEQRRNKFIEIGKNLIDGKGADRLLEKVLN